MRGDRLCVGLGGARGYRRGMKSERSREVGGRVEAGWGEKGAGNTNWRWRPRERGEKGEKRIGESKLGGPKDSA